MSEAQRDGKKNEDLDAFRENPDGQYLTTNQGLRINHTDDSLKAGERGPTLLEDFHFREKIMHFDHERIPERVVHARGAAAHGIFQLYEPLTELTKAGFLNDPARETPVFVRFSTVVGSRGSADTARDVRGFATKFYTEEGIFDLVGNNIPIFFIQDAIKFPDLIHAVKPEPNNEMPQAATAHNTAWDFFSLLPESTAMVMWVMSDRAIPRSFRMMEGFGIHTFRLLNAEGKSRFVKFHWKPLLGAHSLVWDEAQELAGRNPDWHRSDLWQAIESGAYPEWEFGIQVLEEGQEFDFAFDLLDPTKLWPEELIPVRRIGKMTLNRNPDNYFTETEQVAFHPGHLVSGIDFSNDPLLQGRLFSYLDTQLTRLGGPNFAEIPINRPIAPVHNNQRDGLHRTTINTGTAAYSPNSLSGGCPMLAPENAGGFVSYPEHVEGPKTRARSESFKDYFSQATLFWKSLSPIEQEHLIAATHFELGKVTALQVRERMVEMFSYVDPELARRVAAGIGVQVPSGTPQPGVQPPSGKKTVEKSPALSLENQPSESIATRRVAVLAAPGVDAGQVSAVKNGLTAKGAVVEVIGQRLGTIQTNNGQELEVDHSGLTVSSVMYDAVFVPDTASADERASDGSVLQFVAQAYKHGKTIAAAGTGVALLRAAGIPGIPAPGSDGHIMDDAGVITTDASSDMKTLVDKLTAGIAQHRHWNRNVMLVPGGVVLPVG